MLYFLAWHHIIDSVPRVLSCGLYAIYNISTFCLLRFIYYHHKDEHVVPAAFKYVNFFFFFCISVCVFIYVFPRLWSMPPAPCYFFRFPILCGYFVLFLLFVRWFFISSFICKFTRTVAVLCHFSLFGLCNF